MNKLTRENYKEYLYKVYSSWYGKIIGIRLGAPVESWDYKKILETYHGKHGYLKDYGIFAADDDSNGPLFFVRALLDKNDITSEDIGNCFLNYIQEYSGFFWWGGIGISSEHTAYENLKNGIKAPKSGSSEQNGLMIAEQIGGQIFSDCWGYVSGYDPLLAKDLAIKASKVTHDLNGNEGAIFVAVAICLAMQYDDIHKVVYDSLDYLDKNLEYYKVMKDICEYYENNSDDYLSCFDYILNNYGYDKYPGTCHIIPNSSLMVMSLMYGNGDFDYTMEMLNNCGWDTDCNCGNVGSILGALLGIDNIDKKWIEPINDIVNASSCVGCLNIQTISESSRMFAKLAYKLKNIEIVDDNHFDLPYSSEGFFGDLIINNGLHGNGEVYKYSYYLGDDIFDSRYDPEFSPTIYPGYTISVKADKDIEVFAEDVDGQRFIHKNALKIPFAVNRIIRKYGFIGDDYTIYDINIEHTPDVEYDFSSLSYDVYGPRYEGDNKTNIRGFVKHHGDFRLQEGLKGTGFITIGHLLDTYSNVEWRFEINKNNGCYLVFNCLGYLKYEAIGIKNNELIYIKKQNENDTILNTLTKCQENTIFSLKINNSVDKITLLIDNETYSFDYILHLHSLIGIYIQEGSEINTIGLKLF
ncbi:MAG: ADP-ribosylglycohydrolase family protein [Erysipelotrichaceae bacterium]|nr:ADP-ribosylglycohydrolase family protein [Erysipelotrichaceae bacterium]